MKNYEVGIIVAVLILLGYMWYTKSQTQTANPTNANSPGYKAGTP
jgi:predicted negative regulator of RcsB-dependent stress response